MNNSKTNSSGQKIHPFFALTRAAIDRAKNGSSNASATTAAAATDVNKQKEQDVITTDKGNKPPTSKRQNTEEVSFVVSRTSGNGITISSDRSSSSSQSFGSQQSNHGEMIVNSKYTSSFRVYSKVGPRYSNLTPEDPTTITEHARQQQQQRAPKIQIADTRPKAKPSGMTLTNHDNNKLPQKRPLPSGFEGVTIRKSSSELKWASRADEERKSNGDGLDDDDDYLEETDPGKRQKLRGFFFSKDTPPPKSLSEKKLPLLKNGVVRRSGIPLFRTTTTDSTTPLRSSLLENNRMKDTRPALSVEQQRVLDLVVKEGISLFFTGSAGTGKSVLLRAIIDQLQEKYKDGVAVTASTGIAACNINGTTLHSFAGIGTAKEEAEELANKVARNRKCVDRWRRTKVLIIDEISMVSGGLFDKLEYVARVIRGKSEPFGGLQVIISGDFFQLPPVTPLERTVFAFEAKSWKSVIQKTVTLKHVFRQKDETFVRILNEMRLGKLSQEAIEIFQGLSRTPARRSDIEPTELYPMRAHVAMSNDARLNALPGIPKVYESTDHGDMKRMQFCIAPQRISLKVNAQVMLLKNMDSSLVNGSLGVVVGFVGEGKFSNPRAVLSRLPPNRYSGNTDDGFDIERAIKKQYPVVRFAGQREVVIEPETWDLTLKGDSITSTRTQLPLMLAWAMSIHKSQGQTLESVKVDLKEVFTEGQAYVALSRATSLESLQILNFNASKVKAHPRVTQFYKTLQSD